MRATPVPKLPRSPVQFTKKSFNLSAKPYRVAEITPLISTSLSSVLLLFSHSIIWEIAIRLGDTSPSCFHSWMAEQFRIHVVIHPAGFSAFGQFPL
jgi:hypothetical protein